MSIHEKLMTFYKLSDFIMPSFMPWIVSVMLLPCILYGQEQDSTWQIFSYGSPALSIALPGMPDPLEIEIPSSMIDIMKASYAYVYEDYKKGIGVMMLQTTYSKKYHLDMAEISDQVIRDLESRGALDIKYKTSKIIIEGKKGLQQTGTLISQGKEMDFTSAILNQGAIVWKVIIYKRSGDPESKMVTQSIMDSITFKEN